jgi:3-methyladenine DNA glycosylase/8-oxoguanine DNA glycosylase
VTAAGEVVQTPPSFDLDLTVRSHGFYDLAPWEYDPERRVLSRPLLLSSGRAVVVAVAPGAGGRGIAFRVASEGRLAALDAAEARAALRTCLSLDDDLAPFHELVRALEASPPGRRPLPALSWAVERAAGRLLRSPTVYEDAVKTLCTTNCAWALTRLMVKNLVEHLGAPAPGGTRCFPTPAAMAGRDERFYRDVVRAGYRAPWLARLSRAVASGALDVEGWRDPSFATDALALRIRALDGFGPYASEHLLRLLGRYDHLALDSWSRAKLARLRGKRQVPPDATIRRWFAPYGRFAGLALWLELTADWHSDRPTWP